MAERPLREQNLRDCIQACERCTELCMQAAERSESALQRLLNECAEYCRGTAAQLRGADESYADTCRQCAAICSRCAEACERTGIFDECADACRSCAQTCLTMAHGAARDGEHPAAGASGSSRKADKRGAITQTVNPDAALAAVIGDRPLTRADVTRRVWDYIKQHRLQNPENRRMIRADERLSPVFGGREQVSMFEMTRLVNRHLR